jgi:hypothetical protein
MYNIELHIFTNCTQYAPNIDTIKTTYNSFCETFGSMNATVWCDPKPNKSSSKIYEENLKSIFTKVNTTTCFADGYIRAVNQSKSDFLFMLEHDWIFNKKHISHSLDNICKIMNDNNLIHMRFNKRETLAIKWDKNLIIKDDYCLTDAVSNNPHLIHREKFIKQGLPHITVPPEGQRGGVEQNLTAVKNFKGSIYGTVNLPATVKHLDGSNRRGNFFRKKR